MKRLIAMMTAIVMALSLCACGGAPAETTVPPTTTAPPAPAEVYAEAAAKLEALTDVELEIQYLEEMTLGADTFKTSSLQTVTMLGIGTDAFAAFTEDEYYSGSYRVYNEETWVDGVMYSEMNYTNFRAEMEKDDYLDRLLPVCLIDETLYETVEQVSDTEFSFSGAEVLEEWCDNPFTIFHESNATAKLDENGMPNYFRYEAAFQQGAADMDISVTVKVKTPELTEIKAPDKGENFRLLDTPEGPALLYIVAGFLDQSTAAMTTTTEVVSSQAAGFVETVVTTMAAHGKDATTIAKFDTNYHFLDIAADTNDGYTMSETFVDGVLTTVTDGGDPEHTEGLTGYDMQDVVDSEISYLIPDPSTISDYDLTVLGDIGLLEYSFADEYAADYEDEMCNSYFGDPELLSNLASKSEVTKYGGSIGIDLVTGMPLSLNHAFTMTHTIDGQDYNLSADYKKSVQLGALDAYEAITGEKLPVEEPEEKAKPVFYKVTGENGEQMWLLGTIHVGDERTAFLPQEIYDAFNASDALAVEFSTEAYTASLMEDEDAVLAYLMAMMYLDGTTIRDHIADETVFENTVKLLIATGNYRDSVPAALTKPVFHFQTLQNYFMSNGYRLSSDYGVDNQLEKLASEQGKEVLSVESGEFQMDLLADLSDELQELMLKDTIEAGQFAHNYGTQELFEMWCRGDEAELSEYLNSEEEAEEMTEEEKALYEEYETALGGERNVDMLAVAQEYLNSGKVVFYAVGLAHLLSDDGLVNTLRNAGYTVELVSYAG